ncbi:MAG: 2-oxoglutarate/2-oxoacid ferredoxin oxidoreductase subunit beta [Clostridiales bacterium]|nr:2-oxoglutarate/2-oxoacid ferredoxin oxidoreductase subunit beta [Clostridiales bacterium]
MKAFEMKPETDIAWCPGCGNFNIRNALIEALQEMDIPQTKLVLSSGIGQAAKMPQYINSSYFNGLHGRGLPTAVAIKAANPELVVIAEGGDGDMYGEGGNHFIHNIRRNPDITHIVHNNMVYGLTKGQASPTSQREFKTPIQISGVTNEPFNPLAVAIALGATFVARAFSGDMVQMKEILKRAMLHKGYALIDVFQPCVTYNKVNNFMWYKKNSYYVEDDYDPTRKDKAMELVMETDRYAMGVLYEEIGRPTFEEQAYVYREDKTPIIRRTRDIEAINAML